MPHYEERMERDIERIREGVIEIASGATRGLENAVKALLTLDTNLAYQTIVDDHPINRRTEAIERQCHHFVARYLPSAGHLRFVSSVLRMVVELERIGDYAVNIARETATLKGPIEEPIRGEIEHMADNALRMFHSAIEAFSTGDEELARSTMKTERAVVADFGEIFEDLVREGRAGGSTVADLLSKLIVVYSLERVGAQSKNVCEEVVFALTGQRKRRRPVRIIFLDRGNDCAAPMAVALGSKAFPEVGIYASAGLTQRPIPASLVRFMEEVGHGLDTGSSETVALDAIRWKDFDVIISLEGPVSDYVSEVPVSSVAFAWPLPERPAPETSEESLERYRGMYQAIGSRLHDLLETMRGLEEEASHG